MKKEENKKSENKTAATTKSGMENPEKSDKGIKKEAGYPGGPENAAGKNPEKKYTDENHDGIGAKPVSDKFLNLGNK
jgi:hypothetical protein